MQILEENPCSKQHLIIQAGRGRGKHSQRKIKLSGAWQTKRKNTLATPASNTQIKIISYPSLPLTVCFIQCTQEGITHKSLRSFKYENLASVSERHTVKSHLVDASFCQPAHIEHIYYVNTFMVDIECLGSDRVTTIIHFNLKGNNGAYSWILRLEMGFMNLLYEQQQRTDTLLQSVQWIYAATS